MSGALSHWIHPQTPPSRLNCPMPIILPSQGMPGSLASPCSSDIWVDVTHRCTWVNNVANQAWERKRWEGEGEGLAVPPAHFLSIGQTYWSCSQLLPSASPFWLLLASITVSFSCCLPPSLLTLSVVWPPLLSIYFLASTPLLFCFSSFPPLSISIILFFPLIDCSWRGTDREAK